MAAARGYVDDVIEPKETRPKLIVGLESDKQKSNMAWDDLMSASDQISEKWTEVSAADEIRSQREKTW